MVVPDRFNGRPLPMSVGTLGCGGCKSSLNGAGLDFAVGGFAGLGVLLGGIVVFTLIHNALSPYRSSAPARRRRTRKR